MFDNEDKLRIQIDELQSELAHKQALLDQLIEANTATQKALVDKEQRYQYRLVQVGEMKKELDQCKLNGTDHQKRLKNALAMSKRLHIKAEKLTTQITEIEAENTQLRTFILDGKTRDSDKDG